MIDFRFELPIVRTGAESNSIALQMEIHNRKIEIHSGDRSVCNI
jgi:hypothetical protein